jgi:multidrug efflux pump subunit AcrA (membrane-fusion protein)
VAEARAALDVARSDLRRAEEEEAFARLQFDRTQTLMTRGVATVTQMETVAQGLAVAEAAVAAAQSRVAMSEGSLERAEATLARPEGGPRRGRGLLRDPARAQRRGGPVHRHDLGASGVRRARRS